ncbi:hypothetical protein H9651_10210 [Microbacterium sp. Sa4CUA7]|uniref:Lipoprotein n=1 Tax=Microbacterium pullorum TaxID=2762236 RepID=A0ABR8S3F7_9MICO|nr:hypothetical protein [Microbacterium pullorum]MBD7958011.1 hypothetical protein [Microbacterium pullorum]
MMPRRAVAAAAAALLITTALGLAGCAPEPEPTPTPTGFASEAEAFAAAEETYRAYVEALNQVDLSDPDTFEPVFAWTTGELNANDREGLSSYHASGVEVSGTSTIELLEPNDTDLVSFTDLAVCLDVSAIALQDPDGNSLVSPDRSPIQTLLVYLVPDSESPTELLIASIGGRAGAPSCS